MKRSANDDRKQMPRVLLTYGWVRASYAALRNLTDHGVEVWASDAFRTGMC